MALVPAAVAAASIGAVALVGGLAAQQHQSTVASRDTVAAVSAGYADGPPSTAASATPPALGWRWYSRLDQTQRDCLARASISRPLGPLTDAEKATVQEQLRAAATSCGIPVPSGERRANLQAWWNGLSSTQQSCLKAANLTRPVGPLDKAARQTLRQQVSAAAKGCGVTLPKRQATATNPSPSTGTPAPSTT